MRVMFKKYYNCCIFIILLLNCYCKSENKVSHENLNNSSKTEEGILKTIIKYKAYGSLEGNKALFYNDSVRMNSLVLWTLPLPLSFKNKIPIFILNWYRNTFFGILLYLGLGCMWSYIIYIAYGNYFFTKNKIPTLQDILQQIKVSLLAIPLYALLPTCTEYLVENGYTRAYARISDIGIIMYSIYFFLYMFIVEFGVYWAHRSVHDIEILYKLFHRYHHIYNKQHSLSPFAGLAFHPVDGIIQALPYSLALFIVPMHFLTHALLLFLTGVWTTNIHDCIDAKIEPIMGAGYHTIHHVTYKHNYGHYFVYMDWIFGTLITPECFYKDKIN